MERIDLYEAFLQKFHRPPSLLGRAPGHVNLLGDYMGCAASLFLQIAIDKYIFVYAGLRSDDRVYLFAHDLDETVSFHLDQLENKTDLQGRPLPDWALYPAGVAWALRKSGHGLRGLEAVFAGDNPIGVGVSSSAALKAAFAIIWQALCELRIPPLEMARICQHAEQEYIGVNCKMMDQFASLSGEAGHALFIDTLIRDWKPILLPPGLELAIVDPGLLYRSLQADYNSRGSDCEQALLVLRTYLPSIKTLRDVSTTEFAAYSPYLLETPRKRAEHIIKEIQRVQTAVSALKRQDKRALGALLYSSHGSLRDLFEVSRPELDALVDLSRKIPGCYGARLAGGNIDRCTIHLVDHENVEEFEYQIQVGYAKEFGRQVKIYLCQASQGARVFM